MRTCREPADHDRPRRRGRPKAHHHRRTRRDAVRRGRRRQRQDNRARRPDRQPDRPRGVAPQQVAAITFTESAAAELRDRIRRRLEERSREVVVDRDRCTAALADLDRAAIATLHGVRAACPHRACHRGRFATTSQRARRGDVQLRQAQRWEHFVDELYENPGHEELLLRAHALGIAVEARYAGQSTLAGVAATLTQSWDRLAPVVATEQPTLPDIDFAPYERAVADLETARSWCSDPKDKLVVWIGENLPSMRAIAAITDHRQKFGALPRRGKSPWKPGNLGGNPSWGGDKSRAVGAIARSAMRAHRFARLRRPQRAARARVADRLRSDACCRGATPGRAARVPRPSRPRPRSAAQVRARRAALHDRYRYILLDEFQDTDPLQIELATLIAGTVDGANVPPWDAVDVPAGRLFFVGDWKQSIYRFRRADIELFLRASARFRADGPKVGLTSNFRTVEPILSFVNGLFEVAEMADAVGGVAPVYEHLVAARPQPSEPDGHVPVVFGGPSTERADAIRAAEAADVAAAIVDIVERPARWQVEDEGVWRDPRHADITVLVPDANVVAVPPSSTRRCRDLVSPRHRLARLRLTRGRRRARRRTRDRRLDRRDQSRHGAPIEPLRLLGRRPLLLPRGRWPLGRVATPYRVARTRPSRRHGDGPLARSVARTVVDGNGGARRPHRRRAKGDAHGAGCRATP
ncbi:MAG: UvrD-helicase domain-containing protein [Ilumatobacteraceae bacterium]